MVENDKDSWIGIEKSLFKDSVLIDAKASYVKKPKKYGKQDIDKCIICKIILKDENIPRYEIYRNDLAIVFLNIYPYQVGHVLISPIRHVMGYEEFTPEEIEATSVLVQRCITMIKYFGKTESFNIGWNQGLISGGSIQHNHIHVVPRYPNELNFFEIIAQTKPMIQSLNDTHEYLLQYGEFLAGNKTIEELNTKPAW
ncbi:MAG: AP-4-A phosphorylase [Candidatus Heimdallarchaeota archaeon LC_2]|nr:MAG: AP-4-A phosphorylase [Candidatus Heimdallarchaeota archaeon LC_2]